MEFREKAPIEAGFAPVFRARVAPELDRLETERQALLAKAKQRLGSVAALWAVLTALALWSGTGDIWVAPVVLALFAGVAGYFIWKSLARQWGGSLAATVMPPVCDFLGDLSYDREARDRFPLDRAVALGVIGAHNRVALQDRLEGRYRGTDFEVVEAHLRSRSRSAGDDDDTKETTVFKGLLFRISTPEPAPTPILIARDFGRLGNVLGSFFAEGFGRKLPKVEGDHPEVEKHFELHAEDADAARAYVPPAFLDNLLAIAQEESDREGDRALQGMTAGFQRDSFYLALARDSEFLEMGGLTQPVDGVEEELHKVFHDIAVVRRVIDRLHGDTPSA